MRKTVGDSGHVAVEFLLDKWLLLVDVIDILERAEVSQRLWLLLHHLACKPSVLLFVPFLLEEDGVRFLHNPAT